MRRWYEPHLERIHDDAMLRQPDLLQLVQIASTYPSRERFLTELTLDPPDATSDRAGDPLLDEDYLILSTIHSAKGQEWKSVFILNAVDGCLPSDLATGTQRRDRGGAAAPLRRHDARQGPSARDRAAALLRARRNERTATATSTRRARALSRRRCSNTSSAAPGRARRRRNRRQNRRVRPSIFASAYAGRGDDASSRVRPYGGVDHFRNSAGTFCCSPANFSAVTARR